jgi:hypothetical protein
MKKIIVMAALALCGGCVMTTGSVRPSEKDPKVVTAKFYRFAILYPFAVESITLPPGVKIGKYGTDGGAAGIVTIIDAAGNVYNMVKRP